MIDSSASPASQFHARRRQGRAVAGTVALGVGLTIAAAPTASAASGGYSSAASGPSVSVSQTSGLSDGDTVTISGKDYPSGDTIIVVECPASATTAEQGAAQCDIAGHKTSAVGNDGSFSTSFTVAATIQGSGKTTDCTAESCVINVQDLSGGKNSANNKSVAISFGTGNGNTCTSKPFPDVSAGSTFCGDIAWLKGQNITGGDAHGDFNPGRGVTRAQMAAFLYRLSNSGADDPSCTSKPFPDVSAGSTFCGDIAWLKGQDITGGDAHGDFNPGRDVTRAQMAAFLHRLAS